MKKQFENNRQLIFYFLKPILFLLFSLLLQLPFLILSIPVS